MKQNQSDFNRRTVLRSALSLSIAGVAGCLNGSSESGEETTSVNGDYNDQHILSRVAVEGTSLVVELESDAVVDHLNLIQPNDELFGRREIAAGVRQVSFEIGTAYEPGEYTVVAVRGDDTVSEASLEIQPQLEIVDVGLFRNNPDKPWDEVYGESETDSKKNGEAFVTIANTGSGPEAAIELRFEGDVPNPSEEPRDGGIHENSSIVIPPGEEIDLYSSSFPFGAEIGKNGMGCSIDGNDGQFNIVLKLRTTTSLVEREYYVRYSGSDTMYDCQIEITEG